MGMGHRLIRVLRAAIVAVGAMLAADARSYVIVYEFHHPGYDHYFRTANVDEAVDLEANPDRGWVRTGHDFVAHDRSFATGAPGVGAVCRFFAPTYTSHFYTLNAAECDMVRVRWPDVWIFEEVAFASLFPTGDRCPAEPSLVGSHPIPVYRLYNNTSSGNHRYVTDPGLYATMQQKGWLPEGVVMCAYILPEPQMHALAQVRALEGKWQFDSPIEFSGIGAITAETGEQTFYTRGAYTLPDGEGTAQFATYFLMGEDRFQTSKVRSCGYFVFAGLCATHSLEFRFIDDLDHVSGIHKIERSGLFGPSEDTNRFQGVRR